MTAAAYIAIGFACFTIIFALIAEYWRRSARELFDLWQEAERVATVYRDRNATLFFQLTNALSVIAEQQQCFGEIAATISRRPPRRHWLAIARRVSLTAHVGAIAVVKKVMNDAR